MQYKDLHEENRHAWNAATEAHNSHKHDQAGCLRAGGSTLFPEEIALLGDIAGRRLLHLQCNAGQDTLSLAARGALVTGVDISDTAIDFARTLSAETGIPATFVRSDVYDWLATAATRGEQFDLVFSSYGALVWLSDIRAWAQGVSAVLRPGGSFVLVEFHPFASTFDWDWAHTEPYFREGRVQSWPEGVGDYVALSGAALAPSGYLPGVPDFHNPHPGHEWLWGIGEVIGALLAAGLQLTSFQEYPYANGGALFNRMREVPGGRFVPPEDVPNLPLMYSLAAQKPG